MAPTSSHFVRSQQGIALIVTVLLLMMISAIGLAALRHAGDESVISASSRRKLTVIYAADAAMNIMAERLLGGDPTTATFLDPMDEPTFLMNTAGLPIAVRSGPADSAVPQPILRVGTAAGGGGQLNIGSSATQSYGVYRVSIVAQDSGGSQAQVQAQFRVPEGAAGY